MTTRMFTHTGPRRGDVFSESTFVTNSEGEQEHWSARMTAEEFEQTIEAQFEKFKENFLTNLNGDEND